VNKLSCTRLRILLDTIGWKPGFNSLRTPLNHGAAQSHRSIKAKQSKTKQIKHSTILRLFWKSCFTHTIYRVSHFHINAVQDGNMYPVIYLHCKAFEIALLITFFPPELRNFPENNLAQCLQPGLRGTLGYRKTSSGVPWVLTAGSASVPGFLMEIIFCFSLLMHFMKCLDHRSPFRLQVGQFVVQEVACR